jgi:hypothetical protein
MAISLCETFRSLAFSTHAQLAKGRRVGHQPLEETFTDINILELKDRHPAEIYSKTFSKHREGVNGADWEWWLTNSSRSSWLGLRVQAKVLHLATDSFPHLHYKSGTPKTYQLSKLKSEAARDGLFPMYCFYTHDTSQRTAAAPQCRSFPYAPESYGCALTSIDHVENLQTSGEIHDLASVMSAAVPWHCLVCCSGYSKGDLPIRARAYLRATFNVGESAAQDKGVGLELISRPPRHVIDALEGREAEDSPQNVQGILIIAPRDDG